MNFGAPDPALTTKLRKMARTSSACVSFRLHALDQMEARGIDHTQVMTCLKKGTAHALELTGGEFRTNVVHRGIGVRIVVAPKDNEDAQTCEFSRIDVVTAMECK